MRAFAREGLADVSSHRAIVLERQTRVWFCIFREKHLRELSAYSPPGFLLLGDRSEARRRHFARVEHSAPLLSSFPLFVSPFALLLVFERIRADARSGRSPLSATQEMRGAPDVPAPPAQSTSNAYPRIHMRTCFMQMSFLPASVSPKRSSARDGVH